MNKKLIRLTESDLHKIVKESNTNIRFFKWHTLILIHISLQNWKIFEIHFHM